MSLIIHESIKEKLEYFHSIHKIPNILFHGPTGSGKRTIVNDFIHKMSVVLKELRETQSNLKIIFRANLFMGQEIEITSAIKESDELISIFVKSIETSRNKNK